MNTFLFVKPIYMIICPNILYITIVSIQSRYSNHVSIKMDG